MKPLIFLVLLGLGGCASIPQVKCSVQTVLVPTMIPVPSPPVISTPNLPITALSKSSTDGDVALAYEASIVQLQGLVKQYQEVLAKYDELSKQK